MNERDVRVRDKKGSEGIRWILGLGLGISRGGEGMREMLGLGIRRGSGGIREILGLIRGSEGKGEGRG